MGVAGTDSLLQLGELSDSTAKVAALRLAEREELDVRVSTMPEAHEHECVITQVTRADGPQTIRRPKSVEKSEELARVQGEAGAFGWRRRFRNLLCCLAPGIQSDRYFRAGSEGAAGRGAPDGLPTPRPGTEDYPGWVGAPVLPPLDPEDVGKKTLVLDLDETLVHSSFKPVPNAHYVIPVEIEGKSVDVFVQKRPFLEEFMAKVAPVFEVAAPPEQARTRMCWRHRQQQVWFWAARVGKLCGGYCCGGWWVTLGA